MKDLESTRNTIALDGQREAALFGAFRYFNSAEIRGSRAGSPRPKDHWVALDNTIGCPSFRFARDCAVSGAGSVLWFEEQISAPHLEIICSVWEDARSVIPF